MKKKKGGVEMIVIIICAIIFAAIATYFTATIIGNKSEDKGIIGASDKINEEMLTTIP